MGIDTSQFSFGNIKEHLASANESQDILNRLAVDFMSLSALTSKLVLTYMQLHAQKPPRTTIDGAFIDKRKPYHYPQFSVTLILATFFQSLAGKLDLAWTAGIMKEWKLTCKTRSSMVTNIYAKTYQEDKLNIEVRTTCLCVCSILSYTRKVSSESPLPFLSSVLANLLPDDLSVYEMLIQEIVDTKYRFQLLDELKKSSFSLGFANVLALLFKLQRINAESFREMQTLMLRQWTDKNLMGLMLDDLKKAALPPEQTSRTGLHRSQPSFKWHESGLSIMSQHNSLIVLQELLADRLLTESENEARGRLLTSIHQAPYNKVVP